LFKLQSSRSRSRSVSDKDLTRIGESRLTLPQAGLDILARLPKLLVPWATARLAYYYGAPFWEVSILKQDIHRKIGAKHAVACSVLWGMSIRAYLIANLYLLGSKDFLLLHELCLRLSFGRSEYVGDASHNLALGLDCWVLIIYDKICSNHSLATKFSNITDPLDIWP
jgi:hypothetical protein